MGFDVSVILAAVQLVALVGGGFWYAATQSARLDQIEKKLDAIPSEAEARANRVIAAFGTRIAVIEADIKAMQDEVHYLRNRVK